MTDTSSFRTTHANLTSLLDMMRPPVMPLLEPGRDVLQGVLPFSHIYGLFKRASFLWVDDLPMTADTPAVILLPLRTGVPCVIVPVRRPCHLISSFV